MTSNFRVSGMRRGTAEVYLDKHGLMVGYIRDVVLGKRQLVQLVGVHTAFPANLHLVIVADYSAACCALEGFGAIHLQPTEEEVLDLYAQWRADPCWDLETAHGYERFSNTLFKWRVEWEQEQKGQRMLTEETAVSKKAEELDCSDKRALARWALDIERRLAELEGRSQ